MDYKPKYDQSVWDDYMRSCMGDLEPLQRATLRMSEAGPIRRQRWSWSRWKIWLAKRSPFGREAG